MRINQTFEDFDYPAFAKSYSKKHGIDFSETEENLILLDGTILDSSGHYLTYDNDFDQTLPNLLQGVKNPDAEERRKGSQGKTKFFPRKLRRFRRKSIKFWIDDENHLSEILSAYPHLSFDLKMGKRSATELLNLVIYFNWYYGNLHKKIVGRIIFDLCEKRCRANCYQGDWGKLAKILQLQNSTTALYYHVKENFSKRSLYGNIFPTGSKLLEEELCLLTMYPIKRTQRKRGYSDKGSRRDPSKTKNEIDNIGKVEVTRDTLFLNEKEAILHFLYGVTNPAREEVIGQTEIEYRKRMAKEERIRRKKELERIKRLTGPVKVYKKD